MAIADAYIVDERGKRVQAVPEITPAPRWPWKVPPETLLSPDAKRWMILSSLGELCILASSIIIITLFSLVYYNHARSTPIIIFVALIGAWFVLHQIHHWHWSDPGRRHAARAMAAGGTCPSCGYGIAGVPSGADGLTICPECASAWRVGAIAACGRCDYSLMGTQPDADGSMRCPECGWVWSRSSKD